MQLSIDKKDLSIFKIKNLHILQSEKLMIKKLKMKNKKLMII